MSILVLTVLAGAAWYFMSDEDRQRFVGEVRPRLERAKSLIVVTCFAPDPLNDALRERTERLFVLPAIVAINVVVCVCMVASSSPPLETILAWGGNFAPRTGNGEWWRLVTATFVHMSVLSVLVNTAALASAGRVLERLVGAVTFATVYLVAGAMGALSSLWISAVDVTAGASAAVFGVYGLLLACWMWGAFRRSTTTVRLASVRKLAVPAILFITYNLVSDDLATSAEIAGVVSGFMSGLLLTRRAAECKPALLRVGAAAVASAVIVFLLSEPVRGLVDPRTEIAAVVAAEKRMAATYEAAAGRFRTGTVKATDLSSLIDRTILPDLRGINRRVNELGRVPPQHQEVMSAARTYLRMREEGWRLRARALQKASMPMLREADAREQRALRAYEIFHTLAVEASTHQAR